MTTSQSGLYIPFLWMLSLILSLTSGCVSAPQKPQTQKSREAVLKLEIAVAYIHQNNLPMAMQELLEAEKLDPKNPHIHSNLGLVYFLRNRTELSVKHYHEAIKLDPSYTEAKNNLARIYIELKQYKKADALLKEVLNDLTYSNLTNAYFNQGLSYFEQKQYESAATQFSKMVNANAQDCYGQIYLARTHIETNKLQPAAIRLERIINECRQQKIDDADFYLAIAYYRLNQTQKSLAQFNLLLKMFPNSKHTQQVQQMIAMIQKGYK